MTRLSTVDSTSARVGRGSAEEGRVAVTVESAGEPRMRMAGLFAGIGGIEAGFASSGLESDFLCELDPAASAVLTHRYPSIELVPDVRDIRRLPAVEVVAAGFPCQDLSQAGTKTGIEGSRSGLVGEVFRLMAARHLRRSWLVLENVSYMLRLDRGNAMTFLTE